MECKSRNIFTTCKQNFQSFDCALGAGFVFIRNSTFNCILLEHALISKAEIGVFADDQMVEHGDVE